MSFPFFAPATRAALLACALITLASAEPLSQQQILDQSLRYPVTVVPLIDKAPAIDGTLDDQEWSGATLVSDLIHDSTNSTVRSGLAAQHRSRYYVQYDKEALYIGVRHEIPAWYGGPKIKNFAHDTSGDEDNADIFLTPLAKYPMGEKFHLALNAAGTVMDRDLTQHGPRSMWDPQHQCKARVFEGGWEAELRVPFDQFGVTTPAPGDVWQANFVAVRHSPLSIVSAWSYWSTWRHTAQSRGGPRDGYLIFTGAPLAVRFNHNAGDLSRAGVEIALAGSLPPDGADVQIDLFKRDGQFKPTDPGIMAMLSNWIDLSHQGGTDTSGMSYSAIVQLLMKELRPVGEPIRRHIAADSSQRTWTVRAEELGEYLLAYRITTGEGDAMKVLAAGSLPMRNEEPVNVTLKPRVLSARRFAFESEFSSLPALEKAKQARLTVRASETESPLLTRAVEVTSGRAVFDVESDALPAGNLIARVDVLDAAGAVLGFTAAAVDRRTDPDWWTKPAGMAPLVPEPWTPVEASADGKTIRVWGREYRFDGLPTPSYVHATPMKLSAVEKDHAPRPILAEPIRFHLVSEGKVIAWQSAAFKPVEKTPEKVVIESENRGDGFVLRGRTTVEFDGMVRVDFELSSEPAGRPVDSLQLILPYRGDVAELMSTYRKAPGPGTIINRFLGSVPKEPWKYSVFYTHFLGNGRVGMEWFCDDMRGWRVKKPDEAVQVTRDGDRVIEQFNFIDHPVKLDQPVKITFGLIATPAKQPRVGWEMQQYDQNAGLPMLPGEMMKGNKPATEQDTQAWIDRAKYSGLKWSLAFWPHWTGVEWFPYRTDHDPKVLENLKKKTAIANELGVKFCPHGGWQSLSTLIPEWPIWGHEMIVDPPGSTLGKSFYACYNSPYTDFWVANFAANANLVPIDGVRFDTIFPQRECSSAYHGCGWTDENGKLWPSQNLFAAREFFKRNYRVMHGGVRNGGVIYLPLAGPPIMAVDAFVDIHEIGEGNFERAHSIKEGYPQDDVRVRMVGSAYGFVTANNLKGATLHANQRMAALLVAGADPRVGGIALPSYYYRGYERNTMWGPNTIDIWRAWRWIDRGYSSLWMPYWENKETVAVTAPAGAETYCSYYYIPGKRILLIFTNYEQRPLENIAVNFDLAKLGFPAGAKLHAEDAINQTPVDIAGSTVTFGVLAERYRMIQISADTPRFADANLGDNLLPAGAFESLDGIVHSQIPIKGQDEPFFTIDQQVKRSGQASIKLHRSQKVITHTGSIDLKGAELQPGQYVLTAWIRLDRDVEYALEGPAGGPRPDYSQVQIAINPAALDNVEFDPPRRFSNPAGTFNILEATPGWWPVLLSFEVKQPTTVNPRLLIFGVGDAWIDDLALRRVKSN